MKYQHPRFLFRRYEILRHVIDGEIFLEIGSGKLELAQDLSTKFARGVLIDFNDTDTERIYNNLDEPIRKRLELHIADFLEIRFLAKFDCVVACEVLEHIEDDEFFLKQIYDAIKNNGQLLLSVPARQKYWSKDDEMVGHFRRYEKDELISKLSISGFSNIKVISYGFPFQNLIRYIRLAFALLEYSERKNWEKKKQTQKSAFLLRQNKYIDLLGFFINQYTFYPLCLFASLFNDLDLGEGYVVSAFKKQN